MVLGCQSQLSFVICRFRADSLMILRVEVMSTHLILQSLTLQSHLKIQVEEFSLQNQSWCLKKKEEELVAEVLN